MDAESAMPMAGAEYGSCKPVELTSLTLLQNHDRFALALSIFLCVGLVVSYLPQHFRIIHKRSSEGFSPWYLLLGSTSSASALMNMLSLQWSVVRCCKVLTLGSCLENMMGVVQVFLQWFLFTVILVLFLIYYPPHLKYLRIIPLPYTTSPAETPTTSTDLHLSVNPAIGEIAVQGGSVGPEIVNGTPTTKKDGAVRRGAPSDGSRTAPSAAGSSWNVVDQGVMSFSRPSQYPRGHDLFVNVASEPATTDSWKLSVTLAWIVALHFAFITITTLVLLFTLNPTASSRRNQSSSFFTPSNHPTLRLWATFLGLSSTLLAVLQYLPQIVHTFRMKVVGSLSIATMLLQVPGSALFVYSLAVRPGTNWTSWITFLVTGLLQLVLLILCVSWKIRQHKLGIDDFGNLKDTGSPPVDSGAGPAAHAHVRGAEEVTRPSEVHDRQVDETTPLLRNGDDR